MKRILATVFAASLGVVSGVQLAGPSSLSPALARSRSGQLFVYATRGAGRQTLISTNQELICLEPSLVAISGERIKELLWRELDLNAPWHGKIYLALYRAGAVGDPVTLTSERFTDGWQYRIDLPDVIERARYVRVLVQAFTLELANQEARAHSTEVPAWLVEGLTQQLLASSPLQIILSPPPPGTNGLSYVATEIEVRKENPLKRAHAVLSAHPALTFDELSWWADGAASECYGYSSQLFVHELMQLPDGRASLKAMFTELPRYYNWQFAFLHAFHADFTRPLDVEKWWALQVAHFTGRDLLQTWSVAESWEKLNQAVHSTTEGRALPSDLPQPVAVTLQSVIRDWNSSAQTAELQSKIVELGSLRLRIAPEYVEIVDEYQQALQLFLHRHEGVSFLLPFKKRAAARQLTQATIKHLDELDALFASMRPKAAPAP